MARASRMNPRWVCRSSSSSIFGFLCRFGGKGRRDDSLLPASLSTGKDKIQEILKIRSKFETEQKSEYDSKTTIILKPRNRPYSLTGLQLEESGRLGKSMTRSDKHHVNLNHEMGIHLW